MSVLNKEVERKTIHFPSGGIDRSLGQPKQPNRQTYEGMWRRTTQTGTNVRGFDSEGIFRGGSRAGLSRWINAPVFGSRYIVQDLNTTVYTGSPVQSSQSGRVVTVVAVSQGVVKTAVMGATSWSTPTNVTGQTPALNATGVIFSSECALGLWFADGVNYVVFDPTAGEVKPWYATAGTLPADGGGNKPRLIETWRGCIVLSGLLLDQQNWFISAVGDPRNWDYGVSPPTATMAVAGNNSPLGKIGDMITCIFAYNDDVLIFGGDHTIWLMKGDPRNGGQIELVTNTVGMAWGRPICMDPMGNVYFVSNKMGVYRMIPGQQPQRISQAIEEILQAYNTGECQIRMIWNDRQQGCHVFITHLASAQEEVHLFYEARSGAWWQDVFANNDFNPLACCIVDGNRPDDRAILIGSWDGYVRVVDPEAEDDDGRNIESEVVIGPFLTGNLDGIRLPELQAILGRGPVNYSILAGNTTAEALAATPRCAGRWTTGRNNTVPLRVYGHALYLRITGTNPWAFEQARLLLRGTGIINQREGVK